MKDVKDVKVVILWMASIFFVPLLALTFLFSGPLCRAAPSDWLIHFWLTRGTRQTHIKHPSNAIVHFSWLAPRHAWLSVCLFPFVPLHRETPAVVHGDGQNSKQSERITTNDGWWLWECPVSSLPGNDTQHPVTIQGTIPGSRVWLDWHFLFAWIGLDFRIVIPRELSGLCQWTRLSLLLSGLCSGTRRAGQPWVGSRKANSGCWVWKKRKGKKVGWLFGIERSTQPGLIIYTHSC